jgi:hypothetical protein
MNVKALEIRDKATFIPVAAIRLTGASEAQRYLLGRVGLGRSGSYGVAVLRLSDGAARIDHAAWGGRTMPVAHEWIEEHFDELADGDVVDVEHILGETMVRKMSERFGLDLS